MAPTYWAGARASFAAVIVLSVVLSSIAPTNPDMPARTVARIEETPHGLAFQVDSTPIGSSPTNNLLYVLNHVRARGGPDASMIVLVDPQVAFADVWNFEGVADKAQLNNVRFFVLSQDSQRMTELKWGSPVPYSTSPK